MRDWKNGVMETVDFNYLMSTTSIFESIPISNACLKGYSEDVQGWMRG